MHKTLMLNHLKEQEVIHYTKKEAYKTILSINGSIISQSKGMVIRRNHLLDHHKDLHGRIHQRDQVLIQITKITILH